MWIHAVVSSCFIYVWHCLAPQDIRRSFWSAWQSGSLDFDTVADMTSMNQKLLKVIISLAAFLFEEPNPCHVHERGLFVPHLAPTSVWIRMVFFTFFSIMRMKTANKQQRRCSSLHDLHGSRYKTHARHLVSEWHLQIWMCIFASVAKDSERAAKGSRKVWIHLLD